MCCKCCKKKVLAGYVEAVFALCGPCARLGFKLCVIVLGWYIFWYCECLGCEFCVRVVVDVCVCVCVCVYVYVGCAGRWELGEMLCYLYSAQLNSALLC
jgi:hypothetical protein